MAEHTNGLRLIRNLMIGVLVGLILNIPLSIWWAGVINTKVDNNTKATEKLEGKVDKLTDTVIREMGDRYRSSDAKQDFQIRDDKMEKLESRVNGLSHRVSRIEP